MSSVYETTGVSLERRLAGIVGEAMGVDFDCVGVTMAGQRLILRGTAPSYAAKAKASECLRRAGYAQVDNGLRVVPRLGL